jgi:hypothetical protein
MRVRASNVDRRSYCAYCWRHTKTRKARNTHVLKWQRGGELTEWFAGIQIPPGTRRYACGTCAEKIRECEAGRGNLVGVYRYRSVGKDPA